MYRLKAIRYGVEDFARNFENKAAAKEAAQDDYGEDGIRWKVKRNQKGKKVGATSRDLGPVMYDITKVETFPIMKMVPFVPYERTVRDFVEDMISKGWRPKEVYAIALGCRWRHHLEAVKGVLEEFSEN